MNIIFDAKKQLFNLQTENTSYVIGVMHGGILVNLYYGKKLNNPEFYEENLPYKPYMSFAAIDADGYSSGTVAMEYPSNSNSDLRTPALYLINEDGSDTVCLEYKDYVIFDGKKKLNGLPATYVDNENEAKTLEITLADKVQNIDVILSYTVFKGSDVIAKSVRVINNSKGTKILKSVLSLCIHLSDKDYDFVHLEGGWARERNIQKAPLINGVVSVDSKRMSSSHHHSPFMALARKYATEEVGDVYGFSFIYSGNFLAIADTDSNDVVRAMMGINPYAFSWQLNSGEEFDTPEVIMVYSAEGFGKMSNEFHDIYRTRLCRGKYRDIRRPVLINNWEATYFDFDEDKIVDISKKAKDLGIELMVLDDGWFGKRDVDNCSLGDWVPDKKKLPNGITGLAKRVNDLGLQFGLWFEPEMVSPDSDLYRAHPDWCIHVKGRERSLCRNQLILDLSRGEVRDYIVKSLSDILSTANITYVKWDMNRNVSESGSAELPPERQQELGHRYILGLYDVMERVTSQFPDILFEGCSGGGGRFDGGILYYMPQFWTSDDSDAIERLLIQHGTSMVYPMSTMGAHVSAVPNHQMGRTTPFMTRGNVALPGEFGFELDLTKLNDEELEASKKLVEMYKKTWHITHNGDMFRLLSPFEKDACAWEYVTKDKDEVFVVYTNILARVDSALTHIKLRGLISDAVYQDSESEKEYLGETLMNIGLYFKNTSDFKSQTILLKRIK